MLLFYVRHGDPIYEPDQLTPLGHRQAESVARRLALFGVDEVYASTKTVFEKHHPKLFDGQMLHAISLSLTHPRTKERMTFECPLPENFEEALRILREE